jgi:TPR repeat protein
MHDEWRELTTGRMSSNEASMALVLFAAIMEAVNATNSLLQQSGHQSAKSPTFFISYAWETTRVKTERLQRVCQWLRAVLETLGARVWFDINDIEANLKSFMDERIAQSDAALVMGTVRWRSRVADLSSNAAYEYGKIEGRAKQQSEFMIPLLVEGNHGEVFSESQMKHYLIRDLSGLVEDRLSFEALVNATQLLFSKKAPLGLIPMLFKPSKQAYELIVDRLWMAIERIQSQRQTEREREDWYAQGTVAYKARDYVKAYSAYRRAGDRGHVLAMVQAAQLLAYGQGVGANSAEALALIQTAVNAAQDPRVRTYAVSTQTQLKRKHYKTLAESGQPDAMLTLAQMLWMREGVAQPPYLGESQWKLSLNQEALSWIKRAQSQGRQPDSQLVRAIEKDTKTRRQELGAGS